MMLPTRIHCVNVLTFAFPGFLVTAYNQTRAVQYATLAGASYCDANTLKAWTCGVKCFPGVYDIMVCQGSSTQAFVARWNGQYVATFEGTNGGSSVMADLDTVHSGFHGFTVHRGFLLEWQSLQSCVENSLQKIGCSQQDGLGITGHSLGGAVAALAMYDLHESGWNVIDGYTFGMPRVGRYDFASAFDSAFKGRFYRVTHGIDPFIDMPAYSFFQHVEPEVFYKGDVDQGYIICDSPSAPDNKTCAAQYFPDFQGVAFASSVAWHHNYMGVDTSEAGCRSAQNVSCDGDIPESWCTYGIPCNEDVRGPHVYCHHGSVFKAGLGKCHCDDGFCPKDGRCVKKADMENTSFLSTLSQPTEVTPMVVISMFCLSISIASVSYVIKIHRGRERRLNLHQYLIEPSSHA